MPLAPDFKQVIVVSQSSTATNATATGNIDTLGYDWCTLDVITSTSDATANNPATLKLAESDDTVVTNFTDITALVGDGVGGFTIPAAVTSGNWGVKLNVDCRHRKRYLRLSVTPTTTQTVTAIANLFRGEQAPTAASGDCKGVASA